MKKNNNKKGTAKKAKKAPKGFVSLKVDYAFVSVMKNLLVLKGFISAVLNIPPEDILEIIISDRHLNRRFAEDKLGILDVRAKILNIGEFDIEIQVNTFSAWGERVVYYTDKMYIEQMEKGDHYNKEIRAISISVLDFSYLDDTDYFYSSYHIREDKRNSLLTNAKEYHIIELKKLDASIPLEEHENLMKWCRFISAESEEERLTIEQDEYIKEALKELEKLSSDPKKRAEYDAREKAIKDYVTQMMEAEERGEKRGEERGEKRGEKKGREKEATYLNKLAEKLKETGETDMFFEALQNEDVRDRLYKRFQIEAD